MRAVRKLVTGPGLVVDEVEPPAMREDCVVVKMIAAGICGSDLHVYDWSPGYEWIQEKLPITLGHEFAGIVTAVGTQVATIGVGDRVCVKPIIGCGDCTECSDNRPEDCGRKSSIGFSGNGGFAELTLAPERNCIRLPDSVAFDIAALTEPLCVASRATRIGELEEGDIVLVMGPGTIGLAIAYVALQLGASRVAIVGRNDPSRLECARLLGDIQTIDLADEGLAEGLGRYGFPKADKVFEATGVPSTIDAGLRHLRAGGIFVAAGIHPAPATLDITRLVREKQQIRGTINHSAIDWINASNLIVERGEDLRPLITHRFDLSEGVEAFELAHSRLATKVMFIQDE
jgi:L-iditol 2-dehydrogenase